MSLLSVKNLSYSYSGTTPFFKDAVKNVSFSVEKGEIIGIIGHTGSGKSTLVQNLNGLLKPTSGEVLLNGKNIWENPKEIRKVRSSIGLVFQYPEYQLFEETVYADIAFGPKNMGICGDELDSCVRNICKLVGVKDEFLEKSPFDLSGGEKRRVAIAGVMAMNPQILVLDEPTSGLDPKGREDVVKIIKDYRAATNATVIIISHKMEDMAVIADKILVMNKGELFMFEETEKVFSEHKKLQKIGLDVPIVTRVFLELQKRGINLGEVYTIEQAITELKRVREGDMNA